MLKPDQEKASSEMQPERKTVRIACRIPNGVAIRLSKVGWDDGTGVKPTVHDGPGIRLNGPSPLHTGAGNTSPDDLEPGITDVDAEWWGKWLAQNRLNPAVQLKQIFLLEEEAKSNPTL